MADVRQRPKRGTRQSGEQVSITDAQRTAIMRWLRGEEIGAVAREAGISAPTLKRWARAYFQSKLPVTPHTLAETTGSVGQRVRIRRDTWGIAHIAADDERDLFFGLGYAMAQDRLWQLDYQRRLVRGELAAILGRGFVASDREMRTIGVGAAGDRAWESASPDVRLVLEALAAGIDRWTEEVGSRLPVEFEVLGYQPRPWQPADSIAIWKHRWWTLTGRLDQLVLNEVARRRLSSELIDAFRGIELADETIVQPHEQGGHDTEPASPNGPGAGALDEGSNNWVVGGDHTTTGAPVLCSDPHNLFAAPSQWFEAQLTCPTFDAAGAIYIGTTALYLGRNRHVAWGLTNHMISVRDLYQEDVSSDHLGQYRDGDTWRPFEIESQSIAVAGETPEVLELRRTTRGPIVNDIVPLPVDETFPPLSLRWLAAEVDSGLSASLGLLRASSAAEIRDVLRQWPCPPLNYVYADRGGDFGYHAAGLVPNREIATLGLRQANEPDDAWNGFRSFDELPNVANPPRGWVATANNVPWGRDTWYVQNGSWSDGYRAQRIRERLTAKDTLTPEEVAAVHGDVYSIRARDLVPALIDVAATTDHPLANAAVLALRRWGFDYTVGSVGATIWSTFWTQWCLSLARAHFPEALIEVATTKVGGVGRRLLLGESLPWFGNRKTDDEIRRSFVAALGALENWGGSDVREWRWGKLHQISHPHPIATNPILQELYSTGPFPTSGGSTVRAATHGLALPFDVTNGSTYRFMADLSQPDRLQSVQTLGQSGHLSSTHYRDQTRLWLEDRYHPFWMSDADVQANLESETVIAPAGE